MGVERATTTITNHCIGSNEIDFMNQLTILLCVQNMAKGLSGEFLTRHVKLMVLPKFTKISGPPMMLVKGSGVREKAALNDVWVKLL